MENDSIRASGTATLIDLWVEGKIRAICVTKAAIETYLGASAAQDLTEEARCEFVRTHLPELVLAVRTKLRANDPAAGTVVIDAGQLGEGGDRSNVERRKADRRRKKVLPDQLPHADRRRGGRRKTDRATLPASEN